MRLHAAGVVHRRGDGLGRSGCRPASMNGRATEICWDSSGVESLVPAIKHEFYYHQFSATESEFVAALVK